jgi:hypothetical protein
VSASRRRRLGLNAFLMEAGHHEAAGRLPGSNPQADFDLEHWIEPARLAESATFDSLFLADGPALTGTGEFRPPGRLEPLTLLTALSPGDGRLGEVAGELPVKDRAGRGHGLPAAVSPAGVPAQEPPRSRGIFRPASMATGSRFSAGGSGQVARSV